MKQIVAFAFLSVCVLPVHAQVMITEIMYDAPGSDTNREWIEIQNTSADTIDVLQLELIEATENTGRISLFEEGNPTNIAANEFAIITTDAGKFRTDYPNFTGKLFKNTFSLTNSAGKNLAIRKDGVILDSYLYDVTLGAAGDGNTLQKNGGAWSGAPATPGQPFSGSGSLGGTGGTGGTGTTTATTTPATGGGTGSTGGTGGTSTTTATTTPPSTTPVTTGSGAQFVLPQLFGAITAPTITLAGVDTAFTGRTFIIGGKEINYAKYGWNFGDGTIESTTLSKVTKRYKYPGVYSIAMDATASLSNNEVTSIEYASITVVPPEMALDEGVDSEGGRYIEIRNKTQHRVDMSQWILVRGSGDMTERYMLPKNTFIMPYVSVRVAQEVTGFKYGETQNRLELRFSNEKIIAAYDPLGTSAPVVATQKTITPIVQKNSPSNIVTTNPTFGGVPVLTASIGGFVVPTVNSTFVARENVQPEVVVDDVVPTTPSPQRTIPQVASVLAFAALEQGVSDGANLASSTTATSTVTTTLGAKVIAEKTNTPSSLLWYTLFGIFGLGGVFFLMNKHSTENKKDEYVIIDDEK